jgi:uracil-DNA glycosylase
MLIRELRRMGISKRILALGTPVASLLCPGFKNMREDHGTLFYNPVLKMTVVPTYHLAAVMRDPTVKPYVLRDVERFFTLPDPEDLG